MFNNERSIRFFNVKRHAIKILRVFSGLFPRAFDRIRREFDATMAGETLTRDRVHTIRSALETNRVIHEIHNTRSFRRAR